MYYNRPVNDLIDREAAGEESEKGISPVAKKRRQVARVPGMRNLAGVEVPPGVGKRVLSISCALRALMDMKSVNGCRSLGQAMHIGDKKHAVFILIKAHHSGYVRVKATSIYPRVCSGTFL